MSFIHEIGNFNPAKALGSGIDKLLGSGKVGALSSDCAVQLTV
jgi:hypothetical protein